MGPALTGGFFTTEPPGQPGCTYLIETEVHILKSLKPVLGDRNPTPIQESQLRVVKAS